MGAKIVLGESSMLVLFLLVLIIDFWCCLSCKRSQPGGVISSNFNRLLIELAFHPN